MFNKVFSRLVSFCFKMLPPNNGRLVSIFQQYIDHYHGDNNDDMNSNGELNFLERIIPATQVIFDVGANQGDWVALILPIKSNVTIHSFEPSLATFKKLEARNFPPNVTINHFGLSSKPDRKLLYVFSEGSGNNSLYQRRGLEAGWGLKSPEQTEQILLETLDNYCEQTRIKHIDLLKIDVEGHELEVLRGALNMLRQKKIELIQFEYGGSNIDSGVLLKHLFEFLTPLGYRFYKLFPNEARYMGDYDQRWENFRYQNWVASLESL